MLRSWSALLVCSLFVIACEPAPPPVASVSPTEAPVRGGRLVFGSLGDITHLQPILTTDIGSGTRSYLRLIYFPMLEDDPLTGAPRPALASKFDLSADGKKVTFTVRDGVTWSDGVPFTGEDYKYTVEAYARSKKTVAKSKFLNVTGWTDYVEGRTDSLRGVQVSAAGRIVEVDLDRPSCLTLRTLNVSPLPRHHFVKYWDSRTLDTKTSIDDNPYNAAPPASTGAFVFKELQHNDHLTLVRNDRFFRGPPVLDEIVLKLFSQVGATRNAFIAGDLHLFGPASSDVDYVRQQVGATANEYRVSDKLGYTFLAWNQKATNAPWLADKRVRQALWYGLDVKRMVEAVEFGFGHPVFANTPQPLWAYDPTGLNRYDYDVTRARALLESAGARMGSDGIYRWADGRPMEMRVETNTNNPARAAIVQIVQEQYKQIGVRITPVLEAFALLVQRVTPSDGSVEGVVLGWSFDDADPDSYAMWHSSMQGKDGLNFVGMSRPDLDAALERGRNGPDCSIAARKAAYHAMDLILNEEAPYTFLYVADSIVFVSKKLVAPPPAPFGVWPDIEKWWLRP